MEKLTLMISLSPKPLLLLFYTHSKIKNCISYLTRDLIYDLELAELPF